MARASKSTIEPTLTVVEVAPNARGSTAAAVYVDVNDLRPNPRNPRVHRDEVVRLARTILRTAWGAPIVAQARSRRIIGGHGRLEAAKLILRGVEVDGEMRGGAEHRFDASAPPGCVPVRYVDVSDAEADAMTLADNATGLQGIDDASAIVAMAAQFGRESATMADMGFDAAALDALVKSAGDAVLGDNRTAPTSGTPAGDASTEWEGMPDYQSDDKTPHKSITVHFASDEAVDEFKRVTGCRAFGGVNGSVTTWFPPVALEDREVGRFGKDAYVVE